MKNETVIYLIKNKLNEKVYIGSAINYYNRKKQHLSLLKNNKHHSILLQRAWNKYGEDSFVFEIIEVIVDKNELINKEQYYLDLYKSYDNKIGYNICKVAGSTLGFKHKNETKKMMSLTHTGVKTRPCSDETKAKISNSNKNRDSTESVLKRKKTLIKQDKQIFKKIGEKSSKTQKLNGLNKGVNNPNSNPTDILIYNELNVIVYITNNDNFVNLCEKHSLPIRALLKSRASNGEYRLYIKQKPMYEKYNKFKGWYCKYQ
jgi:group I intron endonuclease